MKEQERIDKEVENFIEFLDHIDFIDELIKVVEHPERLFRTEPKDTRRRRGKK